MRFKIFFCFLILSASLAFSQRENTSVILNDSAINSDYKLSRFIKVISKDWNVKFNDSCMILSLKDSVWVSYFNAANRSITDTSEKLFNDSNYIKDNGKMILPEMTSYFEFKWDRNKINLVSKTNNDISKQLITLKKKYHLDHLQEWRKWDDTGFLGATPDDEKRIQQYKHDKKIIEAQKIKVPPYTSSNYSIFIKSQNWLNPLPYMIAKLYPKDKVEGIDQTLEDFFKVHSRDEE